MSRKVRANAPLARAISKVKLLKVIAKACGITEQAVCQWERVPAEHVIRVEDVSGVPRHELRPDLYPKERPKRRTEARQAA